VVYEKLEYFLVVYEIFSVYLIDILKTGFSDKHVLHVILGLLAIHLACFRRMTT